MPAINSRALSLELQLRAAQARIADLEAAIDSKDDDIMCLIDQVRELQAELDRREGESWRPHH